MNYAEIDLQNWFIISSVRTIAFDIKRSNCKSITVSVFYNAAKSHTFLVHNDRMSRPVINTPEFEHACVTENFGIIKEVIVMFELYLRHNGYDGEVKIAEILK